MHKKIIRKLFISCAIVVYLQGCNANKNESILNHFNSLVSESNSIVIRFNSNESYNRKPLVKVIYKTAILDEFEKLMQQTEEESNCNNIDGTMAFFKDSTKTGYLEFSNSPHCPAFYLHYSGNVTQYKMPAYFAMFLESIRQGEK